MARYLGPRCKLARREGVDLMLTSGIRPMQDKCKLDTAPGQFGKRGRLSDYGVQMRMKQLIRRYYGVLEKQFRRYYKLADKQRGSTGLNLLQILESRLDNVVYRLGFASTRAEARQLVTHGAILVNQHAINIPSYLVKPGDSITVREAAKAQLRIKAALELSNQRADVAWIEVNSKDMSGTYKRLPDASELPPEFKVNLVVELYSK